MPAHEHEQKLPIQGSTGPVGEPGLPPSRPSTSATGATSQARTAPSSGPLRKVLGTDRGSRGTDDRSRPESATSRTHIPNITSSAFFNPMTSRQQREQSQRPTSPFAQEPIPVRKSTETSQSQDHRHRSSNASIVTIDQNQRPLIDSDAPPLPISRGGPTAAQVGDQYGPRSVKSHGSSTPLRQQGLPHLESRRPGSGYKSESAPRSPNPLRTSFLGTRGKEKEQKINGHKRLASGPSSPTWPGERSKTYARHDDLGRNYEYYNGNAIFFLHGRLLNARQRPLNVLTAFLTVLPAALFFAFS